MENNSLKLHNNRFFLHQSPSHLPFRWIRSVKKTRRRISHAWPPWKASLHKADTETTCPVCRLAVLRIHDILGWIRIRIWIRGSMPLTNGSGSGTCYFRHWPSQDANKKLIFEKVFLSISFWRYIYIIRVQCGSVGSAQPCCKAGPSSNLGSAPHGGPPTEPTAVKIWRCAYVPQRMFMNEWWMNDM